MNIRILATIIFTVTFSFSAFCEIKLPSVFSNNMLLQQQSNCKIWGKADPNKNITLKTSWHKAKYSTRSDNAGNWELHFETPKASNKTESIIISDGTKLILENILIGELWICSGQSNMEMAMKGFKNQPVAGSNMDILRSKNPSLRLFTVKRNSTIAPQNDVTGEWTEASPETVKEFSATAYYFGRLLQQTLQIPVGLLVTAWGGSSAEAWMSPQMLQTHPEIQIPKSEADIKEKNRTPTTLYQAMIHPLLNLKIKGFIWYQGETNYDRAGSYAQLFTDLVAGWRENWNQTDSLPFYYCQIAPYDYGLITEKGKKVINSAFLREAQAKAEVLIPNSGMAVLLDAGLKTGIHPDRKQIPGERLALLALQKTYKIQGITAESPTFKNIEIHNDTIQISFDRAPMWLTAKNGELTLFQIAGPDRTFVPAKAWIVRSKVYVKSEQIKNPIAVRYAFENFVDGDLFSTEGLPVSSFRSDDWE